MPATSPTYFRLIPFVPDRGGLHRLVMATALGAQQDQAASARAGRAAGRDVDHRPPPSCSKHATLPGQSDELGRGRLTGFAGADRRGREVHRRSHFAWLGLEPLGDIDTDARDRASAGPPALRGSTAATSHPESRLHLRRDTNLQYRLRRDRQRCRPARGRGRGPIPFRRSGPGRAAAGQLTSTRARACQGQGARSWSSSHRKRPGRPRQPEPRNRSSAWPSRYSLSLGCTATANLAAQARRRRRALCRAAR